MKKFLPILFFSILLANASYAQNGGLLERGENVSFSKETSLLKPGEKKIEENDNNTNAPIGNGILFLTALGAAYAIRKKREN